MSCKGLPACHNRYQAFRRSADREEKRPKTEVRLNLMMDVYYAGKQIGNLEREVLHDDSKFLSEYFLANQFVPYVTPL